MVLNKVVFCFLSVVAMVSASTVKYSVGDAEPVSKGIYSFNCSLLAETAFYGITHGGPELEKGLRELRPYGLRFPGGTQANNYLWQKDSFSEAVGDLTGWAGDLGSSGCCQCP